MTFADLWWMFFAGFFLRGAFSFLQSPKAIKKELDEFEWGARIAGLIVCLFITTGLLVAGLAW